MITDRTLDMLQRRIDQLEAERDEVIEYAAKAVRQNVQLLEDNAALHAAARMVIDRSRPVPSADEDGRDVGVAVYLSRGEWDWLVSAAGGYPETPGDTHAPAGGAGEGGG